MISADTQVLSMWYFINKRVLNIIIMDNEVLLIGSS